MPRTEAGKRLHDARHFPEYCSDPCELREEIDAIEAEALAAERARIRAAVERLALPRDAADPTYIRGWDEALNAVLRIIDGEDA